MLQAIANGGPDLRVPGQTRVCCSSFDNPILTGLKALVEERGWEVEFVPLIAGQRSVREKEWLEDLRIFGIGRQDGQRIIGRLDRTLLDEHEKLFGSYW